MSGQFSYDFDEKLSNFNNSRQIHAFLLFSIFFVLFPSFATFFVCALQICRFRSTSFHFSTYLRSQHKKDEKYAFSTFLPFSSFLTSFNNFIVKKREKSVLNNTPSFSADFCSFASFLITCSFFNQKDGNF